MSVPPSTRGKAGYPWPFFVTMLANLALFFGVQALFSILPLYITAIGGSPSDNGLASWAFSLAALLFRPPAGKLADGWGRKPVMVLGAVLFGGGPLCYALAPTVGWLLGARLVHGIGMALFVTASQAYVADLLDPDRFGEGMGLSGMSTTVTVAVAPLVGEIVAGRVGFVATFLVLAAVGGVGVLAVLILPRSQVHDRERSTGGVRQALRRRGVWVGSLGTALLGIPFGAFIVFLPLLTEAREVGGSGFLFTLYALSSVLMQPVAGRIADRWGAGRVALAGLALVGTSMLGLAGMGVRWALAVACALFGVGMGSARVGLETIVQGAVGTRLRGSASAAQYTAFDLLIGFGGWGLGLLAEETGYGAMYGLAGGLTLAGMVVGLVAGRTSR